MNSSHIGAIVALLFFEMLGLGVLIAAFSPEESEHVIPTQLSRYVYLAISAGLGLFTVGNYITNADKVTSEPLWRQWWNVNVDVFNWNLHLIDALRLAASGLSWVLLIGSIFGCFYVYRKFTQFGRYAAKGFYATTASLRDDNPEELVLCKKVNGQWVRFVMVREPSVNELIQRQDNVNSK